MIRKYHNHKLQTNPWHREEEPHSNHETPKRQTKQRNPLSLPHQDDCKTRRAIKIRTTKHRTITGAHNGSNNKQQQNHRLWTDSNLSLRWALIVGNHRPSPLTYPLQECCWLLACLILVTHHLESSKKCKSG